ncbi:MAG: sensor histidine kinase [Alkalibacterium sp.]|nr:sensor histidine kinase [Alkalibacterium sp.]TVP89795.1 MAG: sensor histidine kinase [Alkalibacterium sp.]
MENSAGFFLLYFFYGLAFYTLGISAMLQNTQAEGRNESIFSNNIYLGLFGLLHGTTEWLIMIRPMNFFNDYTFHIYALQLLLNSASFASLLYYGLNFKFLKLNTSFKKVIPYALFFVWLAGLLISFEAGSYREIFDLYSAFSRYFIGIPATFLTAYRFIYLSEKVKVNYNVALARQLKRLSISFILYGLYAGIFISNKGFFPNTVINSALLQASIGLPTEFLRMSMAVIITIIYLKSIKLFRVEEDKKMRHLLEMKLQYNERKRIAQKLHDEIIQELFASGMIIESLINYSDTLSNNDDLIQVKENLNESIDSIRTLMNNLLPKRFSLELFQEEIEELAYKYNELSNVSINTNFNFTGQGDNWLPDQSTTHLYYIIQEAVLNSIKHAQSTKILIRVKSNLNFLTVTISDNGRGFKKNVPEQSGHLGLQIMQDRARLLSAEFELKSDQSGTAIEVNLPWGTNPDE